MTEKQNCWEEMTTEQLDKALHVELAMKQKNRDKIVGILHVLEEREMKQPAQMTKEVRQAWRRYQNQEERTEPSKIKSIVLKVTALAAICCLIIFAVPPIFGEASFIDAIATWTDDIFRFTGTPQKISGLKNYEFKTDHPDLQKIYDTVTELGITQPVVPMWVPEGYELASIQTTHSNRKSVVKAILIKGNKTISLLFDIHDQKTGSEYTKEKEDVTEYKVAGQEYYIFKNEEEVKITWCSGNMECTISIVGDNFNVYNLINSIRGG